MEVLLHQYTYGKPKTTLEVTRPPGASLTELLGRMTRDERRVLMAAMRRVGGKIIDVTPTRAALLVAKEDERDNRPLTP